MSPGQGGASEAAFGGQAVLAGGQLIHVLEASPVEKGLPWPHLPKALKLGTTHLVSFSFPERML